MPPANPSPWIPKSLSPAATAALVHLFEAYESARDLGQPIEQFACQLLELQRLGFPDAPLRQLIAIGFATHLSETTPPDAPDRTFGRNANTRFGDASCFILTEQGIALAVNRPNGTRHDAPTLLSPNGNKPHFDEARRQLLFNGVLVKSFRRPAPHQEIILALSRRTDGLRKSTILYQEDMTSTANGGSTTSSKT